MAYSVCRLAKIKSFGNMGGSEKHTARERETLNADPDKDNIRLIGSPDDPNLETLVREKIGNQKYRKDAVLCDEMLLSASPAYFRPHDSSKAGEWSDQKMWDFAKATADWLKQKYGDKCVRAELHLDEATPHIHAYIVPLDENGKLSHKQMFGSRQKLSQLQDSFAGAVSHLGISRGVKGSKATHTKVKEYYSAVNSAPLSLELDRLTPRKFETASQLHQRIKEDSTITSINHQLADRQRIVEQLRRHEEQAAMREKQKQELEERIKYLEQENFKWRQLADQLRDKTLEDVAYHLGLDSDARGRWKGQGCDIKIDGTKFYDFENARGGGGAIDLVMQVEGCIFKEAIAWLYDRFGESGMLQAATHHARKEAQQIAKNEPVPQFTLPEPDESKWSKVQRHLTVERCLPQKWIDGLHDKGLLYADSKQNAVFVMRSLDNEITGANLWGTVGKDNNFRGLAKGTKRDAGWFYVNIGDSLDDRIEQVVLTEDPIDALSLATLSCPHSSRTMYLVADSVKSMPLEFLREVPAVIMAQERSHFGIEKIAQLKQLLPTVTQKVPDGLNWNSDLVQMQKSEQLQRSLELEL